MATLFKFVVLQITVLLRLHLLKFPYKNMASSNASLNKTPMIAAGTTGPKSAPPAGRLISKTASSITTSGTTVNNKPIAVVTRISSNKSAAPISSSSANKTTVASTTVGSSASKTTVISATSGNVGNKTMQPDSSTTRTVRNKTLPLSNAEPSVSEVRIENFW